MFTRLFPGLYILYTIVPLHIIWAAVLISIRICRPVHISWRIICITHYNWPQTSFRAWWSFFFFFNFPYSCVSCLRQKDRVTVVYFQRFLREWEKQTGEPDNQTLVSLSDPALLYDALPLHNHAHPNTGATVLTRQIKTTNHSLFREERWDDKS